MNNLNKADWPVRKIVYIILGVALFVAMTLGLVTGDQVNGAVEVIGQVTGTLGALGLGVAAAKTHRGSGDRSTEADVLNAAVSSTQADAGIARVENQLESLIARVTPVVEPVEVEDSDRPGIYPGA